MAPRNLNAEEMLQLSGSWLNPNGERYRAITAVPLLVPSVKLLADAHTTLGTLVQPMADPRLVVIVEKETGLDVRHDVIIRSVFGFLTSTADLVGGDEGRRLIALCDLILPDGLASQTKSYRAEAGQAVQLEARLTPEVRAMTDAIQIGQGPSAKSLTAYLEEWIAIGQELGRLEDEKGTLTVKNPDMSSKAVLRARQFWARVVSAMVANAELAELDPKTEALIFGPLRDAEKRADVRARNATGRSKAAAEKAAAEQAEIEKAAADKAAVDQAVKDKLAADKVPADKAVRETAIAYQAVLDGVAPGKAAADKAVAYKTAVDNAAAEHKD